MVDNYAVWAAHDEEMERNREKCPLCADCEEHIQDDYYFEVEGEILCEECMIARYRKSND